MHVSRHLVCLLFALGIASVVSAQAVTATAAASSTLTVTALSTTNTLPAGTDLTGGVTLSASAFIPDPFLGSSFGNVSATFGVTTSGDTITYTIDESGSASGFFAAASAGPHETLLSLTSALPVTGLLTMVVTGSSSFPVVSTQIDVGNNGTVDYATAGLSATWSQPLTVSGTVGVRTITSMSIVPSTSRTLTVTFEPLIVGIPNSQCGPGASPAPGSYPTLSVSSSNGVPSPFSTLSITMAPSAPLSLSLLVIGWSNISLPLPGCGSGSCTLVPSLDDLTVAIGAPTRSIFLPPGFSGAEIYTQGVEFVPGVTGACNFSGLEFLLTSATKVELQ